MADRMILVHGRNHKPSRDDLRTLWLDALRHGIVRDFGERAGRRFDACAVDFVYYGDLSNAYLGVPDEDVGSRRKALEALKTFGTDDFNRHTYARISHHAHWKYRLADACSGLLNIFQAGQLLITDMAPDLGEYWNEDSDFGQKLRRRVGPPIKRALERRDRILLIAHSLGTIATYDDLWRLSHGEDYRRRFGAHRKVDLFVTLGSPLGDENIKHRLAGARLPLGQRYPVNIRRWVNVSALDDWVSHDGRLSNDFRRMKKLGLLEHGIEDIRRICNLNVRNGRANPHSSIGYLVHPAVSELVWNWLEG